MKFLPNTFIIFGFGGFFFKLRPCPVPPPAFTHAVPFRARAAIFGTVDHPDACVHPGAKRIGRSRTDA